MAEVNIKNKIIYDLKSKENWLAAEIYSVKKARGKESDDEDLNQAKAIEKFLSEREKDLDEASVKLFQTLLHFRKELTKAKLAVEQNGNLFRESEKKMALAQEELSYYKNLVQTLTTTTAAKSGSQPIPMTDPERQRLQTLESALKSAQADISTLQSKVALWCRASKKNQEARIQAEACQKMVETEAATLRGLLAQSKESEDKLRKKITELDAAVGRNGSYQRRAGDAGEELADGTAESRVRELERLLHESEDKMKANEAILEAARNRITEFEGTMREACATVDELERENAALAVEARQGEARAAELEVEKERVRELRKVVEGLRDDLRHLEAKNKSLEEQHQREATESLRAVERELSEARGKLEILQETLEDSELTKSDLKERFRETLNRVSELEAENESSRRRAIESEEVMKVELDRVSADFAEREKLLIEEKANMESLLKKEEEKCTHLESEIRGLQMKIESLSSDLQALSTSGSESESVNAKLSAEKQGLENQLAKVLDELRQSEDKVERLEEELRKANQSLSEADSKLLVLESEKKNMAEDISALQERLDRSTEELNDLAAQLEESQDDVRILQDKVERASKDLEKARAEIENLNGDLQAANRNLEESIAARHFAENKVIAELQGELSLVNETLRRTEAELAGSTNQMRTLSEVEISLRSTLKAQNGDLQAVNRNLEENIVARRLAEDKLLELQNELSAVKETLRRMEADLTGNTDQMRSLSEAEILLRNTLEARSSDLQVARRNLEENISARHMAEEKRELSLTKEEEQRVHGELAMAKQSVQQLEISLEAKTQELERLSASELSLKSALEAQHGDLQAASLRLEENIASRNAAENKVEVVSFFSHNVLKVFELQRDLELAEENLRRMEAQLASASQSSFNLEILRDQFEQDLNTAKKDLEDSNIQRAEYQEEIGTLTQRLMEANSTVQSERDRLETALDDVKRKCDEISALTSEREQMLQKASDLNRQVIALQSQLEGLEHELEEKTKTEEQLEEKIETLSLRLSQTEQASNQQSADQIRSMESKIDELQQVNKYLMSQLQKSEEHLDSIERDLGRGPGVMDSVKESLAFQVKSAFQQIAIITEEKNQLAQENASLHRKIATLLQQLDSK
ncbi:hypothetical protein HDU96_002228 [Phlyctochytrium bullatum]|nr:hypothetical protein HDU96_002228 [Phlyctochytrium bullatum]